MGSLKEIKTLSKEKIKKILSGEIIVYEKLDAYRFCFEKRDGKLIFFKKNEPVELSIIDRSISNIYEKGIEYIENLPSELIEKIPERHRFGFFYFPDSMPLRINYKNFKPKNYLVLTDISLRNKKGKCKKVFSGVKFLQNWAEALGVTGPPVLFQGKLSNNQIEMLLEIIEGNEKTAAFFAEHIESIFGKTFSGNSIIEGIVIKTNEGSFQILDTFFKIFDKASTPKISRDFYDLMILNIKDFMQFEFAFPERVKGNTPEERYIEIISMAFNEFIKHKDITPTEDVEFLRPQIIGNTGELNKKFIKNPETLLLVEIPFYAELFKVFLSLFRKKRKPYGLLTEKEIKELNEITEKIEKIINFSPENGIENFLKQIFKPQKPVFDGTPVKVFVLKNIKNADFSHEISPVCVFFIGTGKNGFVPRGNVRVFNIDIDSLEKIEQTLRKEGFAIKELIVAPEFFESLRAQIKWKIFTENREIKINCFDYGKCKNV